MQNSPCHPQDPLAFPLAALEFAAVTTIYARIRGVATRDAVLSML